jgi:ketosteroid isomerase-like protein
MDETSKATLDTVMAFMGAMGGGDMDTVANLMHDDMVWNNEGDKTMPWIGPWNGKEEIFAFLGKFSENVATTHWENEDAFAFGDTVAVFGRMKLKTTKSGAETDEFTFALRAKVKDGKVILWNWFEDSFAVSNAFHGR